MKLTFTFSFVSTLVLLTSGSLYAGDSEDRSLYSATNVYTFLSDARMIKELKISPEQEKSLAATREKRSKIWERYSKAMVELSDKELPKKLENALSRKLETQVSEDLFQAYGEVLRPEQVKRMKQIVFQIGGMEVFDHPEVRNALKIGNKEIEAYLAANDKFKGEKFAEIQAMVKAKKITSDEGARKAFSLSMAVPDSVRALMNKEQQKVFEELHGDRFYGK